MKKYLPVLIALITIGILGYVVISKKNNISEKKIDNPIRVSNNIGSFTKVPSCIKLPQFLARLKIAQPVMIDLSQKQFKGIALLYGKDMKKALHPKLWEKYEYFSTYTLDRRGNIFLIPTPLISIHPTTFNLQKNLYKVDTFTGNLDIFMHFDDVHPSPNNPYGLSAIAYDCDDESLWVATIDETDYNKQRGVIYHIDIKSKQILNQIDGFDALTLSIVKSKKSKYLLAGASRDNGLYAYDIVAIQKSDLQKQKPIKLLELPNVNEHIRKIKVIGDNKLELQSIPFSYTLIAQSDKKERLYYDALWDTTMKKWEIKKY
jgi:hypothetical protein